MDVIVSIVPPRALDVLRLAGEDLGSFGAIRLGTGRDAGEAGRRRGAVDRSEVGPERHSDTPLFPMSNRVL